MIKFKMTVEEIYQGILNSYNKAGAPKDCIFIIKNNKVYCKNPGSMYDIEYTGCLGSRFFTSYYAHESYLFEDEFMKLAERFKRKMDG